MNAVRSPKASIAFSALWLTAGVSFAGLIAKFEGSELLIQDGSKIIRLEKQVDDHAIYKTIHSALRRGKEYYVVYGTSEWTRGWPPRGGNCGSGIESYIRWLHVREGKIVAQDEGLFESCRENREGWSVSWEAGCLRWMSQNSVRMLKDNKESFTNSNLVWIFDPAQPETGILRRE